MNFYKRHLGDIAKATGHLSQGEMGAYDLLLDWCYSNEKPLPLRMADVYRIARGVTKAEKANVERVLADFFDETPDGYTQKRVLQEMAKANAQAETNRVIAEERERKKRERKEHESCNEQSTNRSTNGQPSQTPDSKEQQQEQKPAPHARPPQDPPTGPVTSTEAGRACLLLREAGCARVNPSHVDLRAAIAEGVSPEAIRDTYLEHPDATNPFAWAIATARARHAEGAKPIATGPPRTGSRPQPLGKTAQALHALEAMKRGTELDQAGNPHGLPEAPHARLGSHSGR